MIIYLYTVQKLLGWLNYDYNNLYKNILIDKYGQLDIVKDCKIFLKKIEKLKLYRIEFEENSIMKKRI